MTKNINTLIETLKSSPEIISNYIALIPEEDLDIKRGKDFWTVREHVIHLEYTQDILIHRIDIFKNEEKPVIKPYFPENDKIDSNKFNTIKEVLNSFKSKRNRQIELISQLKDSDLKKEGMHDEYKRYNAEILLHHILFHDYWHIYRIEELWLTKDEYLAE